MTNQQLLINALINTSVAIANNSALKKYRDTCLFVMACDGTFIGSTVVAGGMEHLEKHLFKGMCADPELAVLFKRAYDRAAAEPEVAEKIRKVEGIDFADNILRNIPNEDKDEK